MKRFGMAVVLMVIAVIGVACGGVDGGAATVVHDHCAHMDLPECE